MSDRGRDYYEVLGVSRDASDEEIRRAFRRKAMEYHPDRNKDEDASERFKEVNEAYQVLGDPESRQRYDRFGRAGVGTNGGDADARWFGGGDPFGGFGDIFDAFFGGVGTRSRTARQQGTDVHARLAVSFKEAVFGTRREVEVTRIEACDECRGEGAKPGTSRRRCGTCRGNGQVRRVQQSIFGQFAHVTTCNACKGEGTLISDPCPRCRGSGRERHTRHLEIQIPAGVEDGTQVRLAGEGDAGVHGGPPGHLYIELAVEPDPRFRRRDTTLFYELPLTITQAALGDEITVPTLDGEPETLKIPSGTQPARTFRIKGKGVPRLQRGGRGDLVVVANVVVPKHLSKRQRRILEELDETLESAEDEQDRDRQSSTNWFDRLRDLLGGREG